MRKFFTSTVSLVAVACVALLLLSVLPPRTASAQNRWNDRYHDITVWFNSGRAWLDDGNGYALVARPSVTAVTTLSSANTTVTLTLPASGAGLYHYITSVQATRTCTTAITGTAKLEYTSTNLPGSLAWSSGNACAVGSTSQDIWNDYTQPLKSSVANTATTIVAPAAGAAGFIRVTALYYTGS